MVLDGRWFMHDGMVNMSDLMSSEPGRVIRMKHPKALQYMPSQLDSYDRIAGLISDAC